MPSARSLPLTLGTAGHIDHGKTALVQALTGSDTDRLTEEKRRGISIELGFAALELRGRRRVSLIDVPGHEQLVRTMISGATGIDLFLLVVAADDGVMPQTREHLAILKTLGIESGLVALTKCDLVDELTIELATEEVGALLPGVTVVPVSSRTGMGVERLRASLADVADRVAEGRARSNDRAWQRPAVLNVDRSFTLHGIGTVVTGTLQGTSLATDDRVEIPSRGSEARIRSIEVHDQPVEEAQPGQRVALNLAGVARRDVARGDVIASVGSGVQPSYRLDVELELQSPSAPLDGKRVQVHHGTRDAPARVVILDDESRFAQLRLSAPLYAIGGDRVVIRQIAPPDTLGGGVVADPTPRRHGRGDAAIRLGVLRDGTPSEVLAAAAAEGPIPADADRWPEAPALGAALTRYPPQAWEEGAASLLDAGVLVVERGQMRSAADRVRDAEPSEPAPLALDQRDRAALDLLRGDGATPRSPQALAETLEIERADVEARLGRLAQAGEVRRAGPNIYFESEALDELGDRVVALAVEHDGSISIAEVRDGLETSRKYAQAVLEHLDGEKVMVRRGERHHLRKSARV